MKEDSLAQRFAHGAFWSLAGNVVGRLSTFIGTVIVARFLGQVGFGELAIIQSTIGFLGTFAGLGIGMTATRYVAELRVQDPRRAGRIIALTFWVSWLAGAVMALGCALAAPWLASKTLNAPALAPEIRLASILLLIATIFGRQGGILAGLQSFKDIAHINWLQGLFSIPATAILVWWAGLRGVIISLILTSLVGGAISTYFLKRRCRSAGIKIQFREAWLERKILWKFSLPAFLASVLYTPVIWAANAILVNQPGGYGELGLFNAANQFNKMITVFVSILATVSVPMFAELYGQNELQRFARAFNTNLRLSWGVAVVFGFFAMGLAPWLMRIFGKEFYGGTQILNWTICFTVITIASGIGGQVFYSTGRMWHGLGIIIFWGSLLLTFSAILIPTNGARGLAIAYILTFSLTLVAQLAVIIHLFGRETVSNSFPLSIYSIILMGYAFLAGEGFNYYLVNAGLVLVSLLILLSIIIKNIHLFKKVLSYYFPAVGRKV